MPWTTLFLALCVLSYLISVISFFLWKSAKKEGEVARYDAATEMLNFQDAVWRLRREQERSMVWEAEAKKRAQIIQAMSESQTKAVRVLEESRANADEL